ncbi:hypothetical protein PR202_gb17569 [Eleusine coracana subsp. coracana]|uniref:Uncharacterized protein n=1 Tax=Eleusine coracana subsp. coracana TaxID=191504 RepID=A0AAV5F3V0_ELECO|nr:hypothetical protein QOZ80_6BG0464780 [Eleusine coracana subsp. coracana]GJN29348.1 hypothetical protein PR202_gb17569 [Eleusine coracana subsp. coracana]
MNMNHGEGETSYALNSKLQNYMQADLKPLIEEAVVTLLESATYLPNNIMNIADLGCSSGPNAIVLVATALDTIRRHHGQPALEVCVLLNDLADNDFNTVAKILDDEIKQSHEGPAPTVVTGMVPGSFYTRLFASCSLHLVCTSNSLHWLSKAPEDLVKNRIPAYDSDENLRQARRPTVIAAYRRQFRKDFTLFLSLRARELIPRGWMVLSLVGSHHHDVDAQYIQPWECPAFVLNDMASRGVIDREKLDSFYIPIHGPSEQELREIIEEEGSFEINQIMQVDTSISRVNEFLSVTAMAIAGRAIIEPMIVQHFGPSGEIMDDYARTLEKYYMRSLINTPEEPVVSMCVSLSRKI